MMKYHQRADPTPGRSNNRPRRKGTSIVEFLVALTLLASVVSLVAEALTAHSRQQRDFARQTLALETAANTLEALTALPYEQIEPQKPAVQKLAAEVAETLPGGELELDVQPISEPAAGKKIMLRIHWKEKPFGKPPVQLSTWIYAAPEDSL